MKDAREQREADPATVGELTRDIAAGDIWFAPARVLHGGEVIGGEAAVFLDIYAPPDESIIEFLRTLGEPD